MEQGGLKKASLASRLGCLAISYATFGIVYSYTGFYAASISHVSTFVFDIERHIPFMPLMIVPYMSSGLFFCLVFVVCHTHNDLMVLTKRINFMTVIAGLFFMVIPLKNSFVKPVISDSCLNYFYQFLSNWDTPFNQVPSLHIAYACVYWISVDFLKHKVVKFLLKVWLILMALSTLLTYQHHLIDVVSALCLVWVCFKIFPLNKINLKYEDRSIFKFR